MQSFPLPISNRWLRFPDRCEQRCEWNAIEQVPCSWRQEFQALLGWSFLLHLWAYLLLIINIFWWWTWNLTCSWRIFFVCLICRIMLSENELRVCFLRFLIYLSWLFMYPMLSFFGVLIMVFGSSNCKTTSCFTCLRLIEVVLKSSWYKLYCIISFGLENRMVNL